MNQRRMFTVRFLMLFLFMPVPRKKFYLWTVMSGMRQLQWEKSLLPATIQLLDFGRSRYHLSVFSAWLSQRFASGIREDIDSKLMVISLRAVFDVKLPRDGREKLVETLLDKNRYLCHYRNFKNYVNHGLKVQKLHRVIQFCQGKWPGDYISKNTIMRKQGTKDFEKEFYILMSNACFGKNYGKLAETKRDASCY